ncbi:MAG: M10 family metallopeptidase C-terminal domain-containing protein, partial [Proteobacteria bacterium]|nr:M10 family metallopeptidase C-terminal domain-containing protein [Pseudomonadota bacterium]
MTNGSTGTNGQAAASLGVDYDGPAGLLAAMAAASSDTAPGTELLNNGSTGPQGFGGVPTYIDAVLNQTAADYWNNGSFGTSASVTYCMPTSVPSYDYTLRDTAYVYGDYATYSEVSYLINTFQSFNSAQRSAVASIVQSISEVANINFTQVASASSAQIVLLNADLDPGVAGFAFYPNETAYGTPVGGDVFMDITQMNPSAGNYAYLAVMHEIGHTLGLKHPGDYNAGGGGTEGPYLPSATDNRQYTMMSYYDHPNYTSLTQEPVTPMLYDVAALQYIYGANMSTRAGSTSYDLDYFKSNEIKTIWDAGGTDTIDASSGASYGYLSSQKAWIDLNAGAFSSIGTGSVQLNNVAIAYGASIENAIGGSNADTIVGNALANDLRGNAGNDSISGGAGDDTIDGGTGADTLDGGSGTDTLSYASDTMGVTIDLANGVVSNSGSTDIVLGFENATGGTWDDDIIGNALGNVLNGGAGTGNDTLEGGLGADTMVGGAGNDMYYVDNVGDSVVESAGQGTDQVISYITFSLAALANVENVTLSGIGAIDATGNALANVLYGNAAANILDGGAGNDTMAGGLGNDTYIVDSVGDSVVENAGEGTDLVNASFTFSL